MKIQYLGHSCFRLQFNSGVTVVTDPYTRVGYEMPNGVTADVVTVSHGHFDHNYLPAVKCNCVVADAGTHAINGIAFEGIESYHDGAQGSLRGKNVIFKMMADGMTICHFGDLGEAASQELLDKIGQVDVLLLPIGGTYTIDAGQAKEYIEKIAPKLVIPMHYKPQDGGLDIAGSENFLRLMVGYKQTEYLNGETAFGFEDLPQGKTEILYMERMK